MLGAAAILAGHDLGRMEQLQQPPTALPTNSWWHANIAMATDHAVRAAGARFVEVWFPRDRLRRGLDAQGGLRNRSRLRAEHHRGALRLRSQGTASLG